MVRWHCIGRTNILDYDLGIGTIEKIAFRGPIFSLNEVHKERQSSKVMATYSRPGAFEPELGLVPPPWRWTAWRWRMITSDNGNDNDNGNSSDNGNDTNNDNDNSGRCFIFYRDVRGIRKFESRDRCCGTSLEKKLIRKTFGSISSENKNLFSAQNS